ncbi:MAG: hypothetical protein Q6M04_14675, partial [Thermostichus sp. BF3_bins_97]
MDPIVVADPTEELDSRQATSGNVTPRFAFLRSAAGDLLTAARGGAFDAIVSNPPYVAERARPTLPRELAWEPELALFAGADGAVHVKDALYRCAGDREAPYVELNGEGPKGWVST